MSGKVAKKAPKRKAANAYKLPDSVKPGEILSDLTKKQWILGTSIGVGGFGEVYSAAPYTGKTPKEYPNVIKIEPHGNGPLFVEMHFYMRNAKPDEIDNWRKKKKLPDLGMPPFLGSGSHEYNGTKYRFVVMNRYGVDLWKLFEENNRHFPEHTVYKVAYQIVNVLEYIHNKMYVHADIKGTNLLLGLKSPNQVYLVDFGLASRCSTKEYKLDPRKAHDGTIEYTSRDAHMGIPTMRGDFEILGYNMIQWLCGSLLWEKDLSNPSNVQKEKEKAFSNIDKFLKESFKGPVPDTVTKFMTLVASLKYNDTPNYDKFRQILIDGLKKLNHKPEGKLEFKTTSESVDVSPTKIKKTVESKRKLPQVEKLRKRSPVKANLDDSNVGIVIDKKRAHVKDIKQALDDIESDEEYDIKIVKKSRVKKPTTSPRVVKTKQIVPVKNKRTAKAKYIDDSEPDSEPELVSRGTRSRPTNSKKLPSAKIKAQPEKLIIEESDSENDIFLT